MPDSHKWIIVWAGISSLVVLWDAGYCFTRPHSFRGGKYHWIWKPYSLYQDIDLIYGVEAYARGDGFTAAQSFLNILESIVNFIYVYKAHISKDPIAPLIGFTAATCSFSKTVLYWAQEYFCNYCAVGHNGLSTLFWLWVIPNGAWLIFPGLIMWTLWKDITRSLIGTHATRQTKQHSIKANGKHH